MGQSVSKAFKLHGQPSDGGNLSQRSKGALMDATRCHGDDDLSSPSTASTEDTQPPPQADTAVAAIQAANAFFGSSPWCLQRLSQNGHYATTPKDDARVSSMSRHQPVDIVVESRTPSRPVPVKGADRRQQVVHDGHHDVWHEHDESDDQYLKRLYEMRTWEMFLRITEARKRQRFTGTRGDIPEQVGEPQRVAETQHASEEMSSSEHDMIFACDLE